jgi:hypothetical protein
LREGCCGQFWPAAETHPPAGTLLVVRTGASVAEIEGSALARTFFLKRKRPTQSESITEAFLPKTSSSATLARESSAGNAFQAFSNTVRMEWRCSHSLRPLPHQPRETQRISNATPCRRPGESSAWSNRFAFCTLFPGSSACGNPCCHRVLANRWSRPTPAAHNSRSMFLALGLPIFGVPWQLLTLSANGKAEPPQQRLRLPLLPALESSPYPFRTPGPSEPPSRPYPESPPCPNSASSCPLRSSRGRPPPARSSCPAKCISAPPLALARWLPH